MTLVRGRPVKLGLLVVVTVVCIAGCDSVASPSGTTRASAAPVLARSTSRTAARESLRVDVPSDTMASMEGRPVSVDHLGGLLGTHADRLQRIASVNPRRPFRGEIALAIAPMVTGRTMRAVLRTAASAGFARATLLVMGPSGAPAELAIEPLDAPFGGALQLTIRVRADGLHVCGSGGCLAPGCAQTTRDERPTLVSVRSLGACLARVRAEFPDEDAARIEAADAVPFQDVVGAIDVTMATFRAVYVAH